MITTLTIIRYRGIFIPFALLAMAFHRLPLAINKTCKFWKLMGSGRNGTFDLAPDWNQWALLAVWDSQEDWEKFERTSFVSKWWKTFGKEQWTVVLEALSSHGNWDGKQPFIPGNFSPDVAPVAVLTRATIRPSRLSEFWSQVPKVSAIMRDAPGYIMSVGVGEAPVYRQATFSVWNSLDDVKAFAYRGREHSDVIKTTRERNWYSEELFARFSVITSYGTIKGRNPLQQTTI